MTNYGTPDISTLSNAVLIGYYLIQIQLCWDIIGSNHQYIICVDIQMVDNVAEDDKIAW